MTTMLSELERLPAEIRNKLYRYYNRHYGFRNFCIVRRDCSKLVQPPLAFTNRSIRAELLPMFYAGANFTKIFQDYEVGGFKPMYNQWMKMLRLTQPYVGNFRHIRLTINRFDRMAWFEAFGIDTERRDEAQDEDDRLTVRLKYTESAKGEPRRMKEVLFRAAFETLKDQEMTIVGWAGSLIKAVGSGSYPNPIEEQYYFADASDIS